MNLIESILKYYDLKINPKPIIVQGVKGIGKSHSLLLLFLILSYHKDYRVLYLNELKIL
jgi:hypothetical protein